VDIKPLNNKPVLNTISPKNGIETVKVDTSHINKTALDPKAMEKIEHSVNQVTKKELEQVINNLNRFFGIANKPFLKFQIHEDTDKLMVSIMDLETKKVIRELPPKEILDMEARIQNFVGLLIDEKI
jgi:flagellar protein FlaG